jgi:transcriptional regulator with XRE-family HTH domain
MNLRPHRNRQRLTLLQLARRSRISEGYLSMLETGKRKNPTLATLKKLEKALKVPIEKLAK